MRRSTMNRFMKKVRRVGVAAAAAALGITLFGGATAQAASGYPAYHDVPNKCTSMFDISPDLVVAFRINPNQPERVYWTAWLQKQVGSSWATVPGSNFPWTSFPAAYIDPVKGPVYGALLGPLLPHWSPGGGTYRIISRFYWSGTGTYSGWEPGPACAIGSFIISY
jgi:hypothetical protein